MYFISQSTLYSLCMYLITSVTVTVLFVSLVLFPCHCPYINFPFKLIFFFFPCVLGATILLCPSVEILYLSSVILKSLKRLKNLSCCSKFFLSHSVLVNLNRSWLSASRNSPNPIKADLSSSNCPSTSDLILSTKAVSGCVFQSVCCLSTWFIDSQLLFVHCESIN